MVVGASATIQAGMADGILHIITQCHTTITTAIMMDLSTTTLPVLHIVVAAATTSVDTLHTVVVGGAMVEVLHALLQQVLTAAIAQLTELVLVSPTAAASTL